MDIQKVVTIIRGVCKDLISRKVEFCELDAKAGDGDMGITLVYGCKAVLEYLDDAELTGKSIANLLYGCGEAFEENTGSTLSIIIAEMLYSAATSLGGVTEPTLGDIAAMLVKVGEGVAKRGQVSEGDKTIYDALKPSIDAFNEGYALGDPGIVCLDSAVEAAHRGMENTKGMKARTGRASWMGDQVTQQVDAGSVVWVRIITTIRDLLVKLDN